MVQWIVYRLRAAPLFRYFWAGNGRLLGLAVWRNAGGGVGREQLAVSRRLTRRFATPFHRSFFTDFWSEEKEETARSPHSVRLYT